MPETGDNIYDVEVKATMYIRGRPILHRPGPTAVPVLLRHWKETAQSNKKMLHNAATDGIIKSGMRSIADAIIPGNL